MSQAQNPLVEALFKVGAHFGYSRSRRHATMKHLVYGTKNKTDILDLTKTSGMLSDVLSFVEVLGRQGKMLLFVSGKPEMQSIVREAAASVAMPFVAGRWLGGTLSNFTEIKKRMNRMKELTDERESGVSAKKYTKKERLMIDREIARLEENFTGLVSMDRLPDALVVVDTKREENAVLEAKKLGIPVIGIMNSDCDLSVVSHPVVGNDASQESVRYFLAEVARAYEAGRGAAA
ncbi:30S ribosomal protein S2 [Patescibacteria group bacterium]|nr:30S ribosomal protein S2 [Patescibacteria group bacterium]